MQRRLSFERAAGPHWRTPGSCAIGMVFCALCQGPLYRLGDGARGGKPRPSRLVCSGHLSKACEGIVTPRLAEVEVALRDLAVGVCLTDNFAPDLSLLVQIGRSTQGFSDLNITAGVSVTLGKRPHKPEPTAPATLHPAETL